MLEGLNITSTFTITDLIPDEAGDYYKVNYYKEYHAALNKKTTQEFFKIRKKDLEAKGWKIDGPELHNYIKNGLKILVGFDFDLTLSNLHTFHFPFFKSSLKGGDLTQEALKIFHSNPSLYPFIATNNHAEKVQALLCDWHISDYFNCIKGREDFQHLQGDKELCFQQVNNTLLSNSTLDAHRFLDLDSPEKSIDVVASVIIDDQCHVQPSFASYLQEYNIRTISVNPEHSDIQHLIVLNNLYLNNHLDSALSKYNKIQKTTDLVEKLVTHCENIDEDSMQFNPKMPNMRPYVIYYAEDGLWALYHDLFKQLLDDSDPLDIAKEILNRLDKSYWQHPYTIPATLNKTRGNCGQTLLHFFAAIGNEEAIKLLMAAGADIMTSDYYGNNSLHLLVGENGYLKADILPSLSLLKFLIQSGVDFNLTNENGDTIQSLLSSDPTNLEAFELSAYIFANAGVTMTLEDFLNKNDLEDDDKELFLKFYNKHNIVTRSAQCVLKLITDCEKIGEDTFKCPGLNGVTEFNYGKDFMHYYRDFFKEVLSGVEPAIVAQEIITLLFNECKGETGLIKQRLNTQGILGQTLLHLFATTQDEAAIRLLINVGADINIADKRGYTPLHSLLTATQANKLPSTSLMQYLIDIGANFDTVNESGLIQDKTISTNPHLIWETFSKLSITKDEQVTKQMDEEASQAKLK